MRKPTMPLDINFRSATTGDWPEVAALLTRAQLPIE